MLYQTLSQTAKKNALAEARRLFYVAVTRAKKHLCDVRGYQPDCGRRLEFYGQHSPGVAAPALSGRRTASGGTGTVNLWQQPPLTVRLFEADAEMSSWAEALDRLSAREEGRGAATPEEP